MESADLDRYELIGRILLWFSGAVFVLSVLGAIVIAGSDTQLPFAEDVERQGRGIFALVSIGGGVTAAGLLAGVGAIVSMMAADRRERAEAAGIPTPGEGGEAEQA